ncbi:MAG: hypothetical protein EOL97_16465, partial [Spirochaetia bacterium]|nr:hypothetical protein [Spirochaetia bacterium]
MNNLEILKKFVSTQGYKRNSPDVNNPINVIPSNKITMKEVDFPVVGVDNLGNQILMQPNQDYIFPGDYVIEYPMMQDGGTNPPAYQWNNNYSINTTPLNKPTIYTTQGTGYAKTPIQQQLELAKKYQETLDSKYDQELKDRYGVSAHNILYEYDEEYRNRMDYNASQNPDKIQYSSTDLRRGDNVALNTAWMYPQLEGTNKASMTQLTNEDLAFEVLGAGLAKSYFKPMQYVDDAIDIEKIKYLNKSLPNNTTNYIEKPINNLAPYDYHDVIRGQEKLRKTMSDPNANKLVNWLGEPIDKLYHHSDNPNLITDLNKTRFYDEGLYTTPTNKFTHYNNKHKYYIDNPTSKNPFFAGQHGDLQYKTKILKRNIPKESYDKVQYLEKLREQGYDSYISPLQYNNDYLLDPSKTGLGNAYEIVLFDDKGIKNLKKEYQYGGNYQYQEGGSTGMMKARLAIDSHFGNPTARRMTNYD